MSEQEPKPITGSRPNRLTIQVEGEESVLLFSFSSEEFETLDSFVEQCDALAGSEWVKSSAKMKLSLKASDGVLSSEWSVPSEEMTAAVLHRMRPFLLKKERASFEKVAALVGQRISDPLVRRYLKLLQRRYFGKEFQSTVAISATGASAAEPEKPISATLNGFGVFLEWLNAYEYHRDAEKRRRLEGLTRMLSIEASRAIFLHMLDDAISAVFGLGNLVAMLTGHERKLALTGRALRPPKPKDKLEEGAAD